MEYEIIPQRIKSYHIMPEELQSHATKEHYIIWPCIISYHTGPYDIMEYDMNPTTETELPLGDPPTKWLALLELRTLPELFSYFACYPLKIILPKGDGHTVMVLPGFGASDHLTWPLRNLLNNLNYNCCGWGQGFNRGAVSGLKEKILSKIDRLYNDSGRKISLIGWSLGGVFARELAKNAPDQIRCVISMGSPFLGTAEETLVGELFKKVGNDNPFNWKNSYQKSLPPKVPCTSIYSKTDAIVPWRCSLEKKTGLSESVEVFSSHIGIAHNPLTLYVIADRLSQVEGSWEQFNTR